MTHEEQHDRTQDMAKRMAMAYITASISEGYLQEAVDELKTLRLYRHEVKHRIGMAEDFFSHYDQSIKWIFDYCGTDVKGLLCDDYDVLKEACDRFMNASVRMTEYRYCNSVELRQTGEYLCRVEGLKDLHTAVLRWDAKIRQWLHYVPSQYGSAWQALIPGCRITEVLQTVKPTVGKN